MADLFVLFDLNEPAPEDDDGNVGIDLNEPQDDEDDDAVPVPARPRATGAVPRRREDGQLPGAATGQLRRGAIKAAGAGTSNSPRLAQNDCYCALETRAQNDFYY